MDKNEALKLAKSYKDLLAPYFPGSKTYLFGSFSNDSQSKESDIDIAVIVNEPQGDFFTQVPLLWKLRRQVSTLIEPVLLFSKDKDSLLFQEVMKKGILIQ